MAASIYNLLTRRSLRRPSPFSDNRCGQDGKRPHRLSRKMAVRLPVAFESKDVLEQIMRNTVVRAFTTSDSK